MIVLLVLAHAYAYQMDTTYAPTGNSLTFHFCDQSAFNGAEEDEIFEAMDAWRAGTGETIRGADWTFVRGTDRASGCNPNNGFNEVMTRSATWFDNNGWEDAIAFMDVDYAPEIDLIFNELYAADWVATKPSVSDLVGGEVPVGMVALHEFGHAIGFAHEDDVIAVMNTFPGTNGDLGGQYRPHEDDYVGMITEYPHGSTGKNLMLGRFVEDPETPGKALDNWRYHSIYWWDFCDQEYDDPLGPESVYAAIYETNGLEYPLIEWRLSADNNCFAGTEYVVGQLTQGFQSNTPVLVRPATYDFTGVPAGEYYLCAMIDADGQISESSGIDNTILSTQKLEIIDCP